MDKYAVIRINFKDETEIHSVEFKDTLLEAQQRFFNIVSSDLANDKVTYQATYIIDAKGLMVEGRVFNRSLAATEEV